MARAITRRETLAALTAAPALAQTQEPPPSAPSKLDQAIADIHKTSDTLRAIAIPMDLEPAITFHV